jgi:hypothetical protein
MSDDWQVPAPEQDPEVYKPRPVGDGKGGPRLVPDHNIVEGELEQDGRKNPPSCPFS